jgi:outer membrane protein OmpA-like peptidoglycan-associated protein
MTKMSMLMTTGGLALSLLGTGCATKKYVAKTIAPVETRVTTVEGKNTEQDQKLTANAQQIEGVDKDLSRTKERLTDVDAKAVAAAAAAQAAANAAQAADGRAGGAQTAADGARTLAQQGMAQTSQLAKNVDGTLKLKELKNGSVQFGFNRRTLDDSAKSALDDLARSVSGQERYVVEIQGYTDKTGDAIYNEGLSEDRAQSVARYLANQHKVPLRSITLLGSGVAEGEQKTRDERAQARKVDIRILVPELATVATR